ncbi:predicted protein [Chaetomium globosum CBS 148.51]|uniref:Uncharacterized protein n=1 Tax=Chaetomium globosum (strain ATCC 6205 / CBS 148.51 / DSM 1962 / NBRC 6347 / NRRL 1970) TaxID=306901 RepID=Q2GTN1_CHAGB|nr:uncharacterized protein CHGG_08673 [Chaetomium globosum CBS 148.51]EAQ84659.1 predicted protein [Chaetomium globosum CBS 148.51]
MSPTSSAQDRTNRSSTPKRLCHTSTQELRPRRLDRAKQR